MHEPDATVDFKGAFVPARTALAGRWVTLAPLDPPRHAAALFDAVHAPPADPLLWHYLGYGPFADAAALEAAGWSYRVARVELDYRAGAYYEDRVSTATWAGASSIAIKWEQRPDLSRTGVDVDATDDIPPTWPSQILADDFETLDISRRSVCPSSPRRV